jgi:DNA-binding beta-propeller fold protein YncE
MLFARAGAALAVAALVAGCGDNYRPVVNPINSNGPAPQATSYAVVVSSTGSTTPGVMTIIDYSGDAIMNETPIGPGPLVFTLDELGATGYTVNSDGTLSNFSITTSLQAKNVSESTLPPTARPVNLTAPSSGLWVTDLAGNVVDLFFGSPQAFKLAIPVATSASSATMPVFVAGAPTNGGEREYVLSQNVPDTPAGQMTCNVSPKTAPTGVATPIELSSDTTDPAIPVGKCPVFGVQTPDLQRLFVLNRGDDTVTVINSNKNTLDQCPVPLVTVPPSTVPTCPPPYNTNQNGQPITFHPVLPLSTAALTPANAPPNCNITTNPTCGLGAIAGPVDAEYNAATQQLVVANYDGGTISVIDVSLDEYGNDSATFGTTYTIAVGNAATPDPASVTVLADGSKAYSANQNDDGGTANGTVSVVNLSTHTLEKTLTVVGHPRQIASTQNSEYSKIYVASPDSPFITIIQSSPTVTDLIDTTVLVEGTVVDMRTTTQNGSSGNDNYSSRVPGYGQPCNLPGSASLVSLAQCQAIP